MQILPDAYYDMLYDGHRLRTNISVRIGRINENASKNATSSDTGHVFFSNVSTLFDGNVLEKTYETWEPGRWICDGNGVVPSKTPILKQGYIGDSISDLDGLYNPIPAITFTLSRVHTIEGLTMVFDQSHNDWPEKINISAWRGSELITNEDAFPNAAEWGWGGVLGAVDKITVQFIKARTSGRRPRIQSVLFGDGISFKNNRLVSVNGTREVDPIGRNIPNRVAEFTIENIKKEYDPDNTKGIWNKLLDRNSVEIIADQDYVGAMTWSNMPQMTWDEASYLTWGGLTGRKTFPPLIGNYWMASKSTVKNKLAIFPCVATLDLMTDDYYDGPINGGTLYDLAQGIFTKANLPLTIEGNNPWILWDGLKSITTKAALPIDTGRNLLKLIAHAACCVLHEDRTGIVHIEPISTAQSDVYLDYNEIIERPTISTVPSLSKVDVRVYTYNTPPEAAREIHTETYQVSGSYKVNVDFGVPCSNVTASVSSGTLTFTAYARAFVGTITGNGSITLTIKGKRKEITTTTVTATVQNAGPNSIGEIQDNPLITSQTMGNAVAVWVRDYLIKRRTYPFTTRGRLDIDPTDKIYIQTDYTDKLPGRILDHSWEWEKGRYRDDMTIKGD